MDQLLVDSQLAIPSQLMPLEPEEAGAAELLLEEPESLLEEAELLLEEAELLLEESGLLLEAVYTGLVPTVTTFGRAGVTAVRETSVFAVSAPLVLVTW